MLNTLAINNPSLMIKLLRPTEVGHVFRISESTECTNKLRVFSLMRGRYVQSQLTFLWTLLLERYNCCGGVQSPMTSYEAQSQISEARKLLAADAKTMRNIALTTCCVFLRTATGYL